MRRYNTPAKIRETLEQGERHGITAINTGSWTTIRSKPWIAFKILAAGGLQPRAAFPHAFNSGADFVLVGMFDWQIEEDAKLARRVVGIVGGPNSKRTRPWC